MNAAPVTVATRAERTPAARIRDGMSPARPLAVPHDPPALVSRLAHFMGGTVGVHVEAAPGDVTRGAPAERTADQVLRRIGAWADRLTRFDPRSELSRVNSDPRDVVPIGPTLAAILDWSRFAEGLTDGIVDIGLLDARLAAEHGEPGPFASPHGRRPSSPAVQSSPASRAWSLGRHARGADLHRPVRLRFDLDGVGKGWIADRALDLLDGFPAAVVDADGDIAVRLGPGAVWWFGIADPRRPERDLALIRLEPRGSVHRSGRAGNEGRFGLATSGISVHRWVRDGRPAHHLIDPRTGRPADTDVVQATVLTRTAREAEALAKAAVILGTAAGYALLERAGVDGALLLTDRGEVVIHPDTLRWLG